MREILFKAKRINNGEWVEGSLIVLDADSGYYFITEPFLSASTLPVRALIYNHTHLVDPATLCQYTGLTDKNGKKIWENDVVAHTYTVYVAIDEDKMSFPFFFKEETKVKNYVIKWDSTASYMGYRYHNGRNIFPFKWGTVYNGNDEVIGNIFDNPKLLRGEDDGKTDDR